MRLPFSMEQFLDVFRQYNAAVWPAQWILLGIAAVMIALALRNRPNGNRWVTGLLALLWLWMAVVYHLAFFTRLSRVGVVFGAAFVAQGLMLAWLVRRAAPIAYRPGSRTTAVVGAVLIGYALVVYPTLGHVFGHRYPAAPTFGVPCPTTIFTLGLMVWSNASMPRRLLVIPLAWALVATSAAVNLGMTEDFGLLVAAIATVAARYTRSAIDPNAVKQPVGAR